MSGPPDADHTVLLLPGAMCTAAFYDDLVAAPPVGGIRFVATTLPGFGGTAPLADIGIEGWARGAAELAADLGCDAVVGHSVGANVALEMVATGAFAGPVALLAPSFSSEDEFDELVTLHRIGRVPVLGHLAYAAMLKTIGRAMRGEVPEHRHDALVAEMRKNDAGLCRRAFASYFAYLESHGSVAPRLCESGARAWVVFGENDDVGLTDAERRVLEECATVTLIEIPGAGHMTLNQVPDRIAEIVLETL
jgi:pimeloyl-ACP methyl ester carboxylesterase